MENDTKDDEEGADALLFIQLFANFLESRQLTIADGHHVVRTCELMLKQFSESTDRKVDPNVVTLKLQISGKGSK